MLSPSKLFDEIKIACDAWHIAQQFIAMTNADCQRYTAWCILPGHVCILFWHSICVINGTCHLLWNLKHRIVYLLNKHLYAYSCLRGYKTHVCCSFLHPSYLYIVLRTLPKGTVHLNIIFSYMNFNNKSNLNHSV